MTERKSQRVSMLYKLQKGSSPSLKTQYELAHIFVFMDLY